jgi:hypothetical protein
MKMKKVVLWVLVSCVLGAFVGVGLTHRFLLIPKLPTIETPKVSEDPQPSPIIDIPVAENPFSPLCKTGEGKIQAFEEANDSNSGMCQAFVVMKAGSSLKAPYAGVLSVANYLINDNEAFGFSLKLENEVPKAPGEKRDLSVYVGIYSQDEDITFKKGSVDKGGVMLSIDKEMTLIVFVYSKDLVVFKQLVELVKGVEISRIT